MVDKMRQAFAWALAISALWVSTVTVPIMGLGYWLASVVLDTIVHVARRLEGSWRRPLL